MSGLGAGLAAIACLCAGPGGGPVVASGTSPGGMPWAIHASRNGAEQVIFEFTYGQPVDDELGFLMTLPRPVPYGFALDAVGGSDLGPAHEADVSGVTARRVVRLRVTLADGTTVNTRPVLARAAVTRDRPWLRALRFFDLFLPAGAAEPRRAVAFDARDRVVGRMKL